VRVHDYWWKRRGESRWEMGVKACKTPELRQHCVGAVLGECAAKEKG
jgi:hypothetical protein